MCVKESVNAENIYSPGLKTNWQMYLTGNICLTPALTNFLKLPESKFLIIQQFNKIYEKRYFACALPINGNKCA